MVSIGQGSIPCHAAALPTPTAMAGVCHVRGSADAMSDERGLVMSDVNEAVPTPAEVAETPAENAPETPAEEVLGDAGKRALDAERQARKEAEKRLSEALARVEAFEDSQRTEEEKRQHELETLREQVAEEQKRREAVERDLLVRSVAAEFGLPDELASRLTGEDREALVEDAKTLQKLVAPSGPRKPAPVPEAGTASTPKTSKGELFEEAWRGAFG